MIAAKTPLNLKIFVRHLRGYPPARRAVQEAELNPVRAASGQHANYFRGRRAARDATGKSLHQHRSLRQHLRGFRANRARRGSRAGANSRRQYSDAERMRRRPHLGSESDPLVTSGWFPFPQMLNEILARRVLIVLGKGGVGKTTVSAALAKLVAMPGAAALAKPAEMSGPRALIMECDARAPLAATFGVAPSFVPTDVAPNLALMTLDGRAALEEYLRLVVPGRMLLKAVFASRLYQFFVQAAPGLRELMMLGKVYHEAGRIDPKLPGPSMIIVDAPASGQAMSLLKMPTAASTII